MHRDLIDIFAADESIGSKVTVTTSEEVLIENDSSKNCRKRSLKENASQDVCVAVVSFVK
jgi:hypothetical protein